MYLYRCDNVQHSFDNVQRSYITGSGGDANGGTSATDLVSAISSVVAAIAALVTLLTVWGTAIQIVQRRELYRLGTSKKSLGPWKEKVVAQSFSKMMQTKITTPTISLPKLVQSNWNPQGIVLHPRKFGSGNFADDEQPVEASWVNFLEVLTINPAKSDLYTMQAEPELVNGIVPMRWKGSDLVAICSMLGFQSALAEGKDAKIHFNPMVLPSQWHGPLGWIQFRASSDGCIVEFRRRTSAFKDQLTPELHKYYANLKIQSRNICLRTRAWNSINGLCLPQGKLLYIGGSSDSSLNNSNSDRKKTPTDKICDEVIGQDLEDIEIRRLLWGKKENHPDAIRTAAPPEYEKKMPGSVSQKLDELLGLANKSGAKGKLEVLTPCPGLLSAVVHGELVISRGLDPNDCRELHRTYVDPEDWDKKAYPYKIGRFRMAENELIVLKEAYLQLKPDGFYWSPSMHLRSDAVELLRHIDLFSDDMASTHVISDEVRQQWKDYIETGPSDSPIAQLYYAILLCDHLQNTKVITKTDYTIAEMGVISKASVSLRGIVGDRAQDLIWAIIASPELVSDLFRFFKTIKAGDVLKATVKCQDGILDCTLLMKADSLGGGGQEAKYKVPLLKDGQFSGIQLLAAFFDVFVTYFWIEESVITNVALYDATIPNSITMC